MMPLPILDSHDPPVRVMALHALGYCKRLFYLEEVEEIRVADDRVFAGLQLHAALEANEEGEPTKLELTCESLGLTGIVDCLKRRDGSFLPYEHKRGKPARDADNQPGAWPSDRLQIIAYAVMIEETLGQPIPEGRIRYHAAKTTVRIPIDDAARQTLRDAIQEARQLRDSLERPPITDNPRLCEHCSLAPVCLPEEVRHEREPEHNPIRLFPPDRDGTTLHILSQGAYVGISGDEVVIRPREGPESKHALRGVETLLLHGFAQITTQAIRKAVEHGVGVHWLTSSGYHTASMVPTAGQVQRRIRQYKGLTDTDLCVRLCRQLVLAKVETQYRYLMRATRGNNDLRANLQPSLDRIQPLLTQIAGGTDPDVMRGHEGMAAVHYFTGLRQLIGLQVPDSLRSDARSRRPPLDRFNCLLSYGYGLLHTSVMRALLASGLEPALGFFHTPRSAAYPLCLDLMELFRLTVWEMPLMGSINRNQWNPDQDFVVTKAKVWLSDGGKKKAIQLFEDRLQETWKHPILDYSLSYARTIELEARLLEKEWSGEPGMFAQSRLR